MPVTLRGLSVKKYIGVEKSQLEKGILDLLFIKQQRHRKQLNK